MATDVEARIAQFTELKAKFPDSEMPRWSLATTYEEAGRWMEAIKEFKALVKLKPDYCIAWVHLGHCHSEAEHWYEAKDALEEGRRLAIAQGHNAPKDEAEMLLREVDEELEDLGE